MKPRKAVPHVGEAYATAGVTKIPSKSWSASPALALLTLVVFAACDNPVAPKPLPRVVSGPSASAAVSGTNMTDLGTLVGGGFSYALAINSNGYVVGGSGPFDACCPAPNQSHGFIWSPITGAMSDLGVSSRDYAGGIWSVASAINLSGTIGAYGRDNYWSYTESFMSATTASPVFLTYDPEFEPTGLNSSNVAVGSSPTYIGPLQHAFTFDLGTSTLVDLGKLPGDIAAGANGINDAGLVVGFSVDAGGCPHAVTWNTTTAAINAVPLPQGAGCSTAYGINASGVVVGGYTTPTGEHAFAFDPSAGKPVDLGTLGGAASRAYGVNTQGHVVGWSVTAAGARHAFVYDLGTKVMTDLGVLPNNTTSEARAINDSDKAVGNSDGGAAGQHAVLWTVTFAEASQSITFTSNPPSPAPTGATYSVSATGGGSGNAVTFSSLTPLTCTTSGSTVTLNAVGSCTVAANQAAGIGYSAAAQQTQTFAVSLGLPLPIPPTTPDVRAGWLHTCALKSGGTVICWGNNDYGQTAVPSGLASVAQVSVLAYHVCALRTDGTVVCWGHHDYGQTTVPLGLASVAQVSAGGFHTCAVTINGVVTCWGSNDNGQASVPADLGAASQVTAGFYHTCALKTDGTVACWGYNGYGQATVPAGLTSVKQVSAGQDHSCALRTDASIVCWGFYNPAFTPDGLGPITQVSAGGNDTCALKANGTVACWGNNDNGKASVPAGLASVTRVSAGGNHTCSLKTDGTIVCWGYNFSGQTDVPAGLNLTNADQSITFTSTQPDPALVGGTYLVSAIGGASGNPVIFSSLTPSICTVSGNAVSLNAAGSCTVAANQGSGIGYNAASQQTQTFTIGLSAQSITFTSVPPNPALTGGTYSLAATGGASGNPVTYSSLTASICTVSGGTVALSAAGSCTVAADQAAGNGYTAANQATQTFIVNSPNQVISFTSAPPNPGIVGTTYTPSASGGASGNPVTFSSRTLATCSVNGSTVTFLQIGTCTIAANQAGGGGFNPAAQISQNVTVMATQTITFTSAPPNPALVGTSYSIAVTGGGSGNPVVLSSKAPAVCTVTGRTAKLIAEGTCIVASNQAGGNGYLAAAEATQTFHVQIGQTIKFTSNFPNKAVVGGTYVIAATGGASGNPVVFNSLTSTCTVLGNTARFIAAGACTIAANQDGTPTYSSAPQVTQNGKIK